MAKATKPAAAEPAPARWWRRHLTAVVVGMAVLATGVAYAARPSDAAQIATLLQQLQQGVEREDPALVAAVLSPGYLDGFGCDQRGVLTFLQECLWRPGTVQVAVEAQELMFHTRHRALLTATVRLTGVRLTGARQPQCPFNDAYAMEFDLRREAVALFNVAQRDAGGGWVMDWRDLRADWRNLLTGGPLGWRVVSVRVTGQRAGADA